MPIERRGHANLHAMMHVGKLVHDAWQIALQVNPEGKKVGDDDDAPGSLIHGRGYGFGQIGPSLFEKRGFDHSRSLLPQGLSDAPDRLVCRFDTRAMSENDDRGGWHVMIRVSQMFLAGKPPEARIEQALASQERAPFSYIEVGATRRGPPSRYCYREERVQLGRGQATFERAKQAVREWRMFDVGWLSLHWPSAPIAPGSTVAVVGRHFGFWSLNVARIVYVIEEQRRYGFAYGTLPEHAETGEERFTVEWAEDDLVWYQVCAFSRERHVLARLAYPLARMLQGKFRRDSARAMQRAVVRRPA